MRLLTEPGLMRCLRGPGRMTRVAVGRLMGVPEAYNARCHESA